ncbi:hypothetical protein [Phycicoccus sp. Root101]|uniref:hypothetical protein n=1 Tax=Phycicoccus sp. Root101 TaxID=1736421 RepID=UPI0007033C6B|nr:hypothetical protein [Phycicoccus sp. Root101]KQU65439.1 hypothetical protein ASC58_18375 [Phycicoccus sp. Root101]
MPSKTIITAAAGLVAATGIVVTVASLANASTSTSPSAVTGYAFGYGQQSGEGRGPGGGTHTAVTGSELSKVTAEVKATDSAVTVTSVQKDEDGSYDVFGTKAGAQVMFDVSKDLKTITARTGGPGGPGGRGNHGGGPGGGAHTAVTGTELSKVTAAVKAKDSAVTVTSVRKDEDGSYDVFGTRAGAQVMLEVSKDLKTITARTGGPGGGQGHGPDGDGPGAPGGSTGSGTESNGTQSNGTASTTAFRTV